MNKGKFYLTGPMRGLPLYNFPLFLSAGLLLRAKGYTIVNPAEMDLAAGFDVTMDLEKNKAIHGHDIAKSFIDDFQAILECDGIIVLPGWEKSDGAAVERAVTELCGKRVLRYSPEANRVYDDMELGTGSYWARTLQWYLAKEKEEDHG